MEREIELRLVARLKAGDGAAFEAIFDAYRPRLFSFLVRLSRRRDVAEDLLEETFLRLVRSARQLKDDTCLAAWLFTVARNLHASWRRSRALDDCRLTELVPSFPLPAPGETPFQAAARSETEARLERGLASLGAGDRELLLLASEGVTPSELASTLGVGADALRKRLQRARERLSATMAQREAPARALAG